MVSSSHYISKLKLCIYFDKKMWSVFLQILWLIYCQFGGTGCSLKTCHSANQEILYVCGSRRFISVFRKVHHVDIVLSQMYWVHIFKTCFSKIPFNIIPPPKCSYFPQWGHGRSVTTRGPSVAIQFPSETSGLFALPLCLKMLCIPVFP